MNKVQRCSSFKFYFEFFLLIFIDNIGLKSCKELNTEQKIVHLKKEKRKKKANFPPTLAR